MEFAYSPGLQELEGRAAALAALAGRLLLRWRRPSARDSRPSTVEQ
jgi:hypothetical protein